MSDPKSIDDGWFLFTDGSVHTQSGVGFGACMLVPASELACDPERWAVTVKRFEDTTSSQLELKTLLWALSEIPSEVERVTVCTDSQTIIGLEGRRARLENKGFRSNCGRRLNHYRLYVEFYDRMDRRKYRFIKVRGHASSALKNDLERLFTRVDRAARTALREACR